MSSPSDSKPSPNATLITSIVESHVDTFIDNLFAIYKSHEEAPAIRTLSETDSTKLAICDAVDLAVRRKRNGRTRFSRLDTDIVHSIFGIALDLDQVHDPNFPLHDLDDHRRQLFRMRGVCSTWDGFLLSSPRYWQVLNLKSPPSTIADGIKRSGSASLCVYCIKGLNPPVPEELGLELLRCAPRVQTLRSDDPDAYSLCRGLLQTRPSTLQTLQLARPESLTEPLRDLPRIRHLTAVRWLPSSQDAVWLMGLKGLVLHGFSLLTTEMLLALSACTSLERLELRSNSADGVGDLSGAPITTTLPCLRVLNLYFRSGELATSVIRRLVTPQLVWGSLDFGNPTMGHYADFCQFMCPGEGAARYPHSASIRIENAGAGWIKAVYETESRRFVFELWTRAFVPSQVRDFHQLVQELRRRLREPALDVTILHIPSNFGWLFLESIGDHNVQRIEARLCGEEADELLTAIEAPKDPTDVLETNVSTNQSFESLKRVAIYDAKIDLTRLTVLVETWQQNAQKKSKPWLEEVNLVGCHVREMGLGEALHRLKAIGVTLQSVGCLEVEESGSESAGYDDSVLDL